MDLRSRPVLSNSFLERRSVQEPVERDYRNRYHAFLTWYSRAGMPCNTTVQIDAALAMQMGEIFSEGLPGTDSRNQLAALRYCAPFLIRGPPN